MNICNKYQHETFLKGQEAQLICSYMTASVSLARSHKPPVREILQECSNISGNINQCFHSLSMVIVLKIQYKKN